ncbi:MAG: hypothetical protein A2V81_04985 [Candidatus Abawacabacteria bacterium RBG_16_42_10]|uniref:Uncharacterized protein n=1 Tax=Candidatus Abawacabacteria bacterium RBG_16_42_10 TaxID=1817814 RepID=A0A1F4XJ40_9BACT|nr:MAG: hypothetical protein A2V81_04985 [Candidatus Abawacabacteria bacterium RBG_16_42_10]
MYLFHEGVQLGNNDILFYSYLSTIAFEAGTTIIDMFASFGVGGKSSATFSTRHHSFEHIGYGVISFYRVFSNKSVLYFFYFVPQMKTNDRLMDTLMYFIMPNK